MIIEITFQDLATIIVHIQLPLPLLLRWEQFAPGPVRKVCVEQQQKPPIGEHDESVLRGKGRGRGRGRGRGSTVVDGSAPQVTKKAKVAINGSGPREG